MIKIGDTIVVKMVVGYISARGRFFSYNVDGSSATIVDPKDIVDHIPKPVIVQTGTIFSGAFQSSHGPERVEWTVDIVLDKYVIARRSEKSVPAVFDLSEVEQRIRGNS